MEMHLVRLILSVCVLALLLPAGFACADESDSLEGLTDVEKAYVNRLKSAYAEARASVRRVDDTLTAQVAGALFGVEASPTEIVGAVATCAAELDAIAPAFLDAPPASMERLVGVNQNVAGALSSAFDPCVALTVDEGIQGVFSAGRSLLSDLLGAPEPPPEQQTSFKARIIACITDETGRVGATLQAGEAALDAAVEEIKRAQQLGEDFLEAFLSDECFIATAAYGTRSAVQIGILRDFRDDVLMESPAGRDFIGFYYAASPPLAEFIARRPALRTFVRECLVDPIVWTVGRLSPLWEA